MLSLPTNILSLVFTYTRMRKLAKWVQLDSAGYFIEYIMCNENGIDWAIENKKWLFPRCSIVKKSESELFPEWFYNIASNKSKKNFGSLSTKGTIIE